MPVSTVDEYLASLPADKRAALEKMRRAIRAAVPKAEEVISYGIPTFKFKGRMLGSLGAAARHCALYGFTAAPRDLIKDYDTSPGTIRFPADKPLPVALVKALVKGQVARVEATLAAKSAKGRKTAKKVATKAKTKTKTKKKAK